MVCLKCRQCVCDGPCTDKYNNMLVHALNDHLSDTIYIEKDEGLVVLTNGWRL